MALLSALSSPEKGLPPFSQVESQRLLCYFWLLLSGYVPTSIEYPMTFGALNDDCLLILLDTLSMPQLLQLRGVSRRLCHLIERHSLRKFKTLSFNGAETKKRTKKKTKKRTYREVTGEGATQGYLANRNDVFREWEFSVRAIFFGYLEEEETISARQLVLLRSKNWPRSLPRLLPHLSCLTLEHFLVDQVKPPTEEHVAVNRLFVPYLNSNWSRTLTALHLCIHVPANPQADNSSFAYLNQLTNLKHLFLMFSKFPEPEPEGPVLLLPDSMPILSQLLSFALHYYGDSNVATLLHQLGPDLSLLSLDQVNCSEDDYVTFLRARPNYARTLKHLQVNTHTTNWTLFKVATECLPSLEVFDLNANIIRYNIHRTEAPSILTDLRHLRHLQYIHWIPLFVEQLRALRLRQHLPGTLPSIRYADIAIYNVGENGDSFQTVELFDQLLPLLPRIFCRLESLCIYFYLRPGTRRRKGLSPKQLSTRVCQLFPGLKKCKAKYLFT